MIQSAGLAHINRYLDLPSMIITFGGSFFAILMGSTLKEDVYKRQAEDCGKGGKGVGGGQGKADGSNEGKQNPGETEGKGL